MPRETIPVPVMALYPKDSPVSCDTQDGPEREQRYSHMPNPELARRRPLIGADDHHTSVAPVDIKQGCSYIEPMAGQCENDQFPWGKWND